MPEVLIASDSDLLHDEITSALAGAVDGEQVSFRHLSRGRDVLPSVQELGEPDLYILDLQIGSMGGMATTMEIRLEEDADRLLATPVIMLLDRPADDFLARRSRADAWFVKPVNAVRLRRCAEGLLLDPPGEPTEAPRGDPDLELFEEGEWMVGAEEAGEIEVPAIDVEER